MGNWHRLKTWPEYFDMVIGDFKPFEVREDDRDFKVQDYLVLEEWCPIEKEYTGRCVTRQIVYITDFAQKPNHVVMSLTIV